MNLPVNLRPAWTIAYSVWLANRTGFCALVGLVLGCAALGATVSPTSWHHDAVGVLSNLAMGLSIFATFAFCGFTETNQRGSGYPARLFSLPVQTLTLIAAPVLFGMVAVSIVYLAWAKVILTLLGKQSPVGWPVLYLTVGMACYQSVAWSLARFRIARLIVLSVGGAFLAVGWLAFLDDFEPVLMDGVVAIPKGISVRTFLCAGLTALGAAALSVAYCVVAAERRGDVTGWSGWRKALDFITDTLARGRKSFSSIEQAQGWIEWRRHGVLLPCCTGAALMVIVMSSPLMQPMSPDDTSFTVVLILLLPLMMAFALGKGLGKADLWSKHSDLPLFLATRPLSNTQWIGAKMKTAAWAALSSWLVILVVTPWWICMWGDWRGLTQIWTVAKAVYSSPVLFAVPGLALGVLVLLTWRFLAGSLYVGLSGRNWMLTATSCGVFVAFFGSMLLALAAHNRFSARDLLALLPWLPWPLFGLFVLKIVLALLLTGYAHRRGWVSWKSVYRYLAIWFAGTVFLLVAVWFLVPINGWIKWTCLSVVLCLMPLVSVAGAPMALARNRQR